MVWVGHQERGMTQTQVEPEAASSDSTSGDSEEQVGKDYEELVT